MKSDEAIERDVRDEIGWNPDLDSTDIAISVNEGVVTLTGFARSYVDKYEAEQAAKRVEGVRAVANDIVVRIPSVDARPDPEIARDAAQAIKAQLPNSSEQITAVVKEGWVTLEGSVEWRYQRETAERAVRSLKGVKGVTNQILVQPHVGASEIKRQIEEAFRRNAEVDANQIKVDVHDGDVVLEGTVHSWVEREEAENVAWRAPGVLRVENRIAVS